MVGMSKASTTTLEAFIGLDLEPQVLSINSTTQAFEIESGKVHHACH